MADVIHKLEPDGYRQDAPAAMAVPSERVRFIQRTYLHLAGAIGAFIGLEAVLINSGVGEAFLRSLAGTGMVGMIALMVAFTSFVPSSTMTNCGPAAITASRRFRAL